jgi:hypothetical protein
MFLMLLEEQYDLYTKKFYTQYERLFIYLYHIRLKEFSSTLQLLKLDEYRLIELHIY